MRLKYGRTKPRPLSSARVNMTAKPIPNNREKIVQNLPAIKYATNQLANKLAPVKPNGMPRPTSPSDRLKNSTFMQKMPINAKPRITSNASMRSVFFVGDKLLVVGAIISSLFAFSGIGLFVGSIIVSIVKNPIVVCGTLGCFIDLLKVSSLNRSC